MSTPTTDYVIGLLNMIRDLSQRLVDESQHHKITKKKERDRRERSEWLLSECVLILKEHHLEDEYLESVTEYDEMTDYEDEDNEDEEVL